MEEIKNSITSVMPSITPLLLEQLIATLAESGVEQAEDLRYVQENDLAGHLKPIQCRKLLSAWTM